MTITFAGSIASGARPTGSRRKALVRHPLPEELP